MLIETPYTEGDIVSIKLVGGDELVGKFVKVNAGSYEISKPFLVVMATQGFGFMPYMLTAGPNIKLDLDPTHIIAIHKTLKDVASQYIKQTTGLIT